MTATALRRLVLIAMIAAAIAAGCRKNKTAETGTSETSGTTAAATGTPDSSSTAGISQYDAAQFAASAKSINRADLLICRNKDSKITEGSDATPEELAKVLHGTWLRRLTIHGVPVETNSYLSFDMNGASGKAFMIDRVNLGADKYMPGERTTVDPKKMLEPANLEAIEQGKIPGGEMLLPHLIAAHWDVSLTPTKATKNAGRTLGHTGVAVKMNGDYHGSDDKFPAGGLNFTEQAEMFKNGNAFVIVAPWVSPSTGYEHAYLWDQVVINEGVQEENIQPSTKIDFRPAQMMKPRVLTFVNCEHEFVDMYIKISDAKPAWGGTTVAGGMDMMSVEPASKGMPITDMFNMLKSQGALDVLPGFDKKTINPSPWP